MSIIFFEKKISFSCRFSLPGGTKRYASRKLDPVMFPEHKRFWDLEPTDLQVRAAAGMLNWNNGPYLN